MTALLALSEPPLPVLLLLTVVGVMIVNYVGWKLREMKKTYDMGVAEREGREKPLQAVERLLTEVEKIPSDPRMDEKTALKLRIDYGLALKAIGGVEKLPQGLWVRHQRLFGIDESEADEEE